MGNKGEFGIDYISSVGVAAIILGIIAVAVAQVMNSTLDPTARAIISNGLGGLQNLSLGSDLVDAVNQLGFVSAGVGGIAIVPGLVRWLRRLCRRVDEGGTGE